MTPVDPDFDPDLVRVLPDAEVLDDAMLLEDGSDVGDVDGLWTGLSDETVGNSGGVILRVAPCDVYSDLLQNTNIYITARALFTV